MGIKSQIHNSVRSRVEQATFYRISFHPETKAMVSGEELKPTSISFNEIRTRWSPDSHRRTDFIIKKNEWLWELNLEFEAEIDSEEFEREMEDKPVSVQVGKICYLIMLSQAEYTIPPRQLENTGTRIKYTLAALNLGA